MNNKISAVINTYNEEKNIKECITSLSWADEIIIVDMHSTDKTATIARKQGAIVYVHEKKDYVEPARNFALKKATNDWVFVLDADERVPKTLVNKIKTVIENNKITHVLIPRKNIILGKWIKHCAEWPNHQTRLFKKSLTVWTDLIHSQPIVSGKEYRLPANEQFAILHFYYSRIDEFLSTINIYSTEHANRLQKEGVTTTSIFNIIKTPIFIFLHRYIRAKGFKDGEIGFIHSVLMSFYYFLVYAKLWQKNNPDN